MFRSFFLAGFECATGANQHGEWIDQIAATEHDRHVDDDYRALATLGIRAIREGARWPLIDRKGRYDFGSLAAFVDASQRHGLEVIWDLFHYGYPEDLDPFGPEFPRRFAAYCHATARYICARSPGPWYFTPINEPSYFSWAGGHAARFAPHATERGWELKVALARAGICGINAIRAACPSARIVNADPWCGVVPPRDRPDLAGEAEHFNRVAVFESWDMLCGRLLPELGGSRDHLDVVGINYYWTNQWEHGRDGVPLADDDERKLRLGDIVRQVHDRYGGDLMITETSHVGERRGSWVREVAQECEALLEDGVPIRGVCLYPILGMPEWHERDIWTPMGLWDCRPTPDRLHRELFMPMRDALVEAQRLDRHLDEMEEDLDRGDRRVSDSA